MTHAQKCPLCFGRGKLLYQDYYGEKHAINPTEHPCYGCNEKGWIEVSDTNYYVPPAVLYGSGCTCGLGVTAACPIHNRSITTW